MEKFVVIDITNKEVKKKILGFLASETEADYKVTSDLKKFVSEKYDVTILDNSLFAPAAYGIGEPTPTNAEIVGQSAGSFENIPPSFDFGTTKEEQGIFEYYTKPFINPNHEDIIEQLNEVETGTEFFDNTDHKVEEVLKESTPIDVDVLSTSIALKRRTTEEQEMPAPKKQAKRMSKALSGEECKKCSFVGRFDGYTTKYRHVLTHTSIKSYGCFVDGCEVRVGDRNGMVNHMKRNHPNQLTCFGLIPLSRQENENIETTMRECFPLPDIHDKTGYCRVCNYLVCGEGDNAVFNKRSHAQNHLSFTLYKCMEPECHFEGKTKVSMQTHRRAHPGVANPKVADLKLNDSHFDEIESTFIRCFPEFQPNGGDNN